MFTPRRLALSVMLAVALTGCATAPLDGKSADAAAIYTLQHNAMDSRYNFSGDVRVAELQVPDELGRLAGKELVGEVAKSFSMQVSGAMDLPANRIELVPTLRFARPNLESWVRVPMLFDIASLTAWVDASAVDLAFPQLKGKLIKVSAPQDKVADLPVRAILRDMPLIIGEAYAAVEKKAFTFQPLSEQDRQLGASYRIRLALDPAADAALSRDMASGILQRVQRYSQNDKVKKFAADMLADVESSREALQSDSQTDLLISRQAQLLGMQEQRTLTLPKVPGLRIVVKSQLAMSNHGQPVFTLRPDAANELTPEQLKAPDWFTLFGRGSAQADDEAADAVTEPPADAAAETVPAVPAQPAAKAKEPAKPPLKKPRQ
ncbi:MAG: hypothetical protein ACK4FZ_17160 [Vogesella sp.]|uniref:hypothetical protein n=1 Tax=Vogesella sp. TaxID=1904252 RepID=UPI00391DCEA1